MEKQERLIRQIKAVYTKIASNIDPAFKFPDGGRADGKLAKFINRLTEDLGGQFSPSRCVDYCIFQIHKNRTSLHQSSLSTNTFGDTAYKKYRQMSAQNKTYAENQWLNEIGLTREELYKMVNAEKREHPQIKYIYMPSEDVTKRRCLNTEIGLLICETSTLMWSPFSPVCQQCNCVEDCKKITETKYPELYRIRIEKYGESEKR